MARFAAPNPATGVVNIGAKLKPPPPELGAAENVNPPPAAGAPPNGAAPASHTAGAPLPARRRPCAAQRGGLAVAYRRVKRVILIYDGILLVNIDSDPFVSLLPCARTERRREHGRNL